MGALSQGRGSGRVVVIGAGPAGCAAGVGLARAGFGVTIVESRGFPRVKVCGEFISPAATSVLEALAPPTLLRARGGVLVKTLTLRLGELERRWDLPARAWAIPRADLDTLLLETARECGATVLQPARVDDVAYAPDAARVRLAPGAARTELAAEVVLHADGHGRFDPGGAMASRRGVVALKCHYRPQPGEQDAGVTMHAGPGTYVGTLVTGSGAEELGTLALVTRARTRAGAAASGRGDEGPQEGQGEDWRDRLVEAVCPGWSRERRCTPWLASGVPGAAFRAPGHDRSIRLGNAAAGVEPLGGEGIGLALWSGARLAELARSERGWPEERAARTRVQAALAAEYRARLRVRRPACRLASAVMMRPPVARAAWGLLRWPTLVLAPWYALTGKHATA